MCVLAAQARAEVSWSNTQARVCAPPTVLTLLLHTRVTAHNATKHSDIDLVVTGLVRPSSVTGTFAAKDRQLVLRALERIAGHIRK